MAHLGTTITKGWGTVKHNLLNLWAWRNEAMRQNAASHEHLNKLLTQWIADARTAGIKIGTHEEDDQS